MNTVKIYKTVMGLLAFFLISGCASLGIPERRQTGMTVQALERDWNDYTVYYSATPGGIPTAIMFAPKNSENKLVGKSWTRVENRGTLSGLILRVQAFSKHVSSTWSIMGPNNQLFGYIFTPSPRILMKAVDNHTVYVYRVPSRQEITPR
jgi:hypothetical protein